MVNLAQHLTVRPGLFAQQQAEPLLEQLDPPRRAMVLMALLGLVLLGITLVACIMIGGRWVRRLARSTTSRETGAARNNAWRKVLSQHLPDVSTGDTAVVDRGSDDTVAD